MEILFDDLDNNFETTLDGDITDVSTTINLVDVPGNASEGFLAIDADNAEKLEYIYFNAKGVGFVSCPALGGRGQGGTTAVDHDSGAVVRMYVMREHIKGLRDTVVGFEGRITDVETATETTLPAQIQSEVQLVQHNLTRQSLINGNFDVWQRGTAFTSATIPENNDDTYLADRWNLISDGNDAVDLSRESTQVPEGSTYSMKWDVETSKRFGIVQFLEFKDAKKLKGKTVSLSFQVKSANIAAIRAAVLSWAGTADTLTSDIVGTWADTPTWAASWTAENTPADLTVTSAWTTVKIEGIVLDSATINNIAIALWLPNQETIGDIIYISQVQLNVGATALPFQPKSFDEECNSCQRYYEKSFDYDTAPAQNAGTNGALSSFLLGTGAINRVFVKFSVSKLKIPSITTYNPSAANANWRNVDGSTDVTAGSQYIGTNSTAITLANVTTQFNLCLIHWTADAEL